MRRPTRFLLGFTVALATYISLLFLVPRPSWGWHRYGPGWHHGYHRYDQHPCDSNHHWR